MRSSSRIDSDDSDQEEEEDITIDAIDNEDALQQTDDEDGDEDDDDDDDEDDLFASTLGSEFLDLFARNGMMDESGSNGGSEYLSGSSGGLGPLDNMMSLSPRPASVGPPMNTGTNTLMTAATVKRSSPSGRNSAGKRRATTAAHTY